MSEPIHENEGWEKFAQIVAPEVKFTRTDLEQVDFKFADASLGYQVSQTVGKRFIVQDKYNTISKVKALDLLFKSRADAPYIGATRPGKIVLPIYPSWDIEHAVTLDWEDYSLWCQSSLNTVGGADTTWLRVGVLPDVFSLSMLRGMLLAFMEDAWTGGFEDSFYTECTSDFHGMRAPSIAHGEVDQYGIMVNGTCLHCLAMEKRMERAVPRTSYEKYENEPGWSSPSETLGYAQGGVVYDRSMPAGTMVHVDPVTGKAEPVMDASKINGFVGGINQKIRGGIAHTAMPRRR